MTRGNVVVEGGVEGRCTVGTDGIVSTRREGDVDDVAAAGDADDECAFV
jgi:hypothetical protein